MHIRNGLILAALSLGAALAQQGGRGARPAGGFVPGQQRKPEDAAQVARGKALYGIHCTSCHGADLRGGDIGGPNLLRSQLALSDKEGELIVPVILGSRQAGGMPAIPVSQDDAKAGEAYFQAKCAQCHSVTGDLKGIAARMDDPRALQNAWVSGGGGRRGRGPAAAPAAGAADPRAVTATVKLPSGETFEGRVVRIDDFLVTLRLADNSIRSFTRDGDVPKVVVNDPMKGHRDLLSVYTDKDIHDVTAYLVTLK